jgi:hypothetical protein
MAVVLKFARGCADKGSEAGSPQPTMPSQFAT